LIKLALYGKDVRVARVNQGARQELNAGIESVASPGYDTHLMSCLCHQAGMMG
jgi:hypothetical protein